jgi:hypothetical protein
VWRSCEFQTIDVLALSRARGESLEYAARRALATGCRQLVLVTDHDPEQVTAAFAGLDDLVRHSRAQLTVVRRTNAPGALQRPTGARLRLLGRRA